MATQTVMENLKEADGALPLVAITRRRVGFNENAKGCYGEFRGGRTIGYEGKGETAQIDARMRLKL